jgi:hypothetical protein
MAEQMLSVARTGLERRGLGEEEYLVPLEVRAREGKCPADDAAQEMRKSGIPGLLKARHL